MNLLRTSYSLLLIGLVGFALFLFGRYGAGSAVYWHLDDWGFMQQVRSAPSLFSALDDLFPHPHRLVGYLHIYTLYYLVGNQSFLFLHLAIWGYAGVLAMFTLVSWFLFRSRLAALLSVLLFVLWPNLTENFHWPNIMTDFAGRSSWGILIGLLGWIKFQRDGGNHWWILSLAGYAYGLACGEIAAPLPGALMFLVRRWDLRRIILWMIPYALLLGVYIAYRYTNSFGFGGALLYGETHFQIRPSLFMFYYQGSEYASALVGSRMLASIANGWMSLLEAPPRLYRWLIAGNLIIACAVGFLVDWFLNDSSTRVHPLFAPESRCHDVVVWPFWQQILFALVWMFVFWLPMWVAHTEPRMFFLPSIGASLLVAAMLYRFAKPALPWLVGIWCFIALGANQGTNLAWQETGRFNQRLMAEIEATEPQWREKEVILFDSRAVRERVATDLHRPLSAHPYALIYYRNASFLRGFCLGSMLSLAQSEETGRRPAAVLDIETDARWMDDTLHWHVRFNPGQRRTTPREQVFIFDMGRVIVGE